MPAQINNVVNTDEIAGMIEDWLMTPPNGYLGSDYGCDIKALLHLPVEGIAVDAFIEKMIKDIEILSVLPSDSVNVYAQNNPTMRDAKDLFIQVLDKVIKIPTQ